jgi:RNA polymerase sigma factor (sigma-70 family)
MAPFSVGVNTSAFAELWRRHYRSAARVARQFTSSIDADDLVSEAYVRILQRVQAGGGPTGAFRPYLYTTIRNLASTWGAASRDIQVDVIEEFEDDRIPDDPAAWALDRTLTAKAFRSLPERWQTVLWYTEVEGMDPHEVAPLMGLTANGVAALSYRAREGLRTAWLQAHISNAATSIDCQWTMSRLGDRARNSLTAREKERVELHLLSCAKCAVISEEVEEVGSHLALVMVPLLLGGVAGGALLASLAHPSAALPAEAVPAVPAAAPAVVHAVAGGGVLAAPVLGGLSLGAATGTTAIIGSLAIIAVIGGGVALDSAGPPLGSESSQLAASGVAASASTSAASPDEQVTAPRLSADPTDPASTSALTGAVAGAAGDVVNGVGQTVNEVGQAAVDLHLAGSATPGATVTAQLAGAVSSTVVASNGTWSITLSGLPQSARSASATISQKASLLPGLLGALGLSTPCRSTRTPWGCTSLFSTDR